MARIAGRLYLTGVLNLLATGAIGAMVVSGNGAATLNNVVAHETLYRLVLAGDLVTFPC